MNKTLACLALLTVFQTTAALAASAPDQRDCNLLGREIALRAAEELTVSLNAEARARLAAIAESTCLANPVPAFADTAAAAAPDVSEDDPATRELFDLEIIEPQDRVRRPGLKRR
jgi:hypothetical protein